MLNILLSYYLFRPQIFNQHELEQAGLINATLYCATRAFGVEDYNDEGPHYFIELKNGAVMYLVGQYLYDYEPIDADPKISQPRKFPCTEFTIIRHKERGDNLDLKCGGRALEPEHIFRIQEPFYTLRRLLGFVPKDGDIIIGQSYDTLKDLVMQVSRCN
jgi:hypothetical protein